MKVRILFFGATSDDAGTRVQEMSVQDHANAQDALEEVQKLFPKLSDRRLLLAVNQEYVGGDRELDEGDEIAIFTAVSGG